MFVHVGEYITLDFKKSHLTELNGTDDRMAYKLEVEHYQSKPADLETIGQGSKETLLLRPL